MAKNRNETHPPLGADQRGAGFLPQSASRARGNWHFNFRILLTGIEFLRQVGDLALLSMVFGANFLCEHPKCPSRAVFSHHIFLIEGGGIRFAVSL
jgi:hypothetical protein